MRHWLPAQLLSALTGLQLQNTGNWCYANSITYCILWCILSLQTFEPADWGE